VVRVVDVAAGGHEGLHCRIGVPSPGDARIRIGPLHPFRRHERVVAVRAMGKGGLADPDRGGRTMDVLEESLLTRTSLLQVILRLAHFRCPRVGLPPLLLELLVELNRALRVPAASGGARRAKQ
jgi:hypothetical protein